MTNNLFSRAFLLIGLIVCCSPVLSAQDDTAAGPRNDVKVTLLSLGSGSSRFTYERAVTAAHQRRICVHPVKIYYIFNHHPVLTGIPQTAGIYVAAQIRPDQQIADCRTNAALQPLFQQISLEIKQHVKVCVVVPPTDL